MDFEEYRIPFLSPPPLFAGHMFIVVSSFEGEYGPSREEVFHLSPAISFSPVSFFRELVSHLSSIWDISTVSFCFQFDCLRSVHSSNWKPLIQFVQLFTLSDRTCCFVL